MNPMEVACPECAQQPGEACVWDVAMEPCFHAARIEAAAFMEEVQREANEQAN